GAAIMFFAAGAFSGTDAMFLVLPGAASGLAGLLLWGRGAKVSLPETAEQARLQRQVGQVQDSVEALHQEVRMLREGREFDAQLYPGEGVDRQRQSSSGRA